MKDVKIPYGRTGSIEFNEEGDRKSVNFDLINYGENSTPNVVGMFISEYNTTIEQVCITRFTLFSSISSSLNLFPCIASGNL